MNDRQREILHAVVEDYIRTAEPVGSRTLTKRKKLNLSPATVRNVMSDLEGLGLLSAPHASAGRVPTPAAFRYYVERLATRGRISPRERELISAVASLKEDASDINAVLHQAGQVLSAVSKHASLVLMPSLEEVVFKHIEFVQIRDNSVLTIFVAKSGLIQHRTIEVEFSVERTELQQMSNYLSTLLGGKTLSDVRREILHSMNNERSQADDIMRNALLIGERVLSRPSETDMVVEGERRFFDQPEFADIEKMKKLLKAFEQKTILLGLLDAAATENSDVHAATSDSTAVIFGSEIRGSELRGLAAVTASYTSSQGPAGKVGVVGPTRMDYSRVIPLVELTADTISQTLGSGRQEELSERQGEPPPDD